MFIQTETTPNPNSLKFIPGKIVSNNGSFEITKKDNIKNELIRSKLIMYSKYLLRMLLINISISFNRIF